MKNIIFKIGVIVGLNFTDIVATVLLLKTGMFKEGNYLLQTFVNKCPVLCVVFKTLLPLILLMYVYYRLKDASEKEIKRTNTALSILVVFYLFVNATHIMWFLMLKFYK